MNKQSRLAPVPASACSPVAGAGTNPLCGEAQHELQSRAETGSPGAMSGKSPVCFPSPTMECRECGGRGEAEYMGLTDSYYRWADCHKCFGSGREAPYCEVCEGKLTVDGFCYACDDYALAFVERIAPGRIAL